MLQRRSHMRIVAAYASRPIRRKAGLLPPRSIDALRPVCSHPSTHPPTHLRDGARLDKPQVVNVGDEGGHAVVAQAGAGAGGQVGVGDGGGAGGAGDEVGGGGGSIHPGVSGSTGRVGAWTHAGGGGPAGRAWPVTQPAPLLPHRAPLCTPRRHCSPASVDGIRDELAAQGVHLEQRCEASGVAEIVLEHALCVGGWKQADSSL